MMELVRLEQEHIFSIRHHGKLHAQTTGLVPTPGLVVVDGNSSLHVQHYRRCAWFIFVFFFHGAASTSIRSWMYLCDGLAAV